MDAYGSGRRAEGAPDEVPSAAAATLAVQESTTQAIGIHQALALTSETLRFAHPNLKPESFRTRNPPHSGRYNPMTPFTASSVAGTTFGLNSA